MKSSLSDEDLIRGILGGDEDAFSQLYDRYRQRVFATAYRILQNSQEAQDATQEIFIKVYRTLRSYDCGKSKFSTWLYRITTNLSIDHTRLRRRRAELPLVDGDEETELNTDPLFETCPSLHYRVEGKEMVMEVRRCVDMLPDLQKRVFILRYFEDLKLEEIAKIEECSLGTIKASLFRATHAMRRQLERFREL